MLERSDLAPAPVGDQHRFLGHVLSEPCSAEAARESDQPRQLGGVEVVEGLSAPRPGWEYLEQLAVDGFAHICYSHGDLLRMTPQGHVGHIDW